MNFKKPQNFKLPQLTKLAKKLSQLRIVNFSVIISGLFDSFRQVKYTLQFGQIMKYNICINNRLYFFHSVTSLNLENLTCFLYEGYGAIILKQRNFNIAANQRVVKQRMLKKKRCVL